MTAMQSPRRIASAASPTLWVPVAQADTTHMLWPIAPVSMAIIPEQLSVSALAMNVGATVRGPRSLASSHEVVEHQRLPAGARPEDDPDLGPVLVGDLEARIGQRLLRGGDAEVHARLAPPGGLRVHPVGRHEVVDLAAELGLVWRRVEPGDRPEAGHAVDEAGPGGRDVVADGADDAETGDDHTTVVVGLAQDVSSVELVVRPARRRGRAGDRGSAGSSAAMTSASGAMRLIRPVRTRPGTDLDEGRHAGGGHPLDGADPVHPGGQVLDELGAAGLGRLDRTGVRVGEERHVGIGEGDLGEGRAHARRPPRP